MEKITESTRLPRELFGLLLVFWALLLLLSLITFDPGDPSLSQVVSKGHEVKNGAGLVGAYLAGLLADVLGVVGFAFPVAFASAGVRCFVSPLPWQWWRWLGYVLFSLCIASMAAAPGLQGAIGVGGISGGGYVGNGLHHLGSYYLRPTGGVLLWLFMLAFSFQLMTNTPWSVLWKRTRSWALEFWHKYCERRVRGQRRVGRTVPRRKPGLELIEPPLQEKVEPVLAPSPNGGDDDHEPLELKLKPKKRGFFSPKPKPGPEGLPPLDLLPEVREEQEQLSAEELQALADKLGSCLSDFNVQGEVQNISPGPVVTLFEFKPAPGVKVSRIAGLSNDLALAMKALAVRIEAPIPGRDTVGIEIPSKNRSTVHLRNILDNKAFKNSKSLLTMALGHDISGRSQVADLARMPHLLVAGATGAGKSVCLNSILLSFLYKAKPEELKLLLIDPKRIELSVYQDLPHLVHPVVTEMHLAKSALDWAVHEMDQRYEAMARIGARNIEGYNQKLRTLLSRLEAGEEEIPEELVGLEPMPFLVIIIDELADLMLTAAKEVEVSVVRLAQLARAAGIHMILATQRPSVDVVTGLIKANFPCRISFQVTSKHDSRTILDQVGAEYLLGKGDMLFKPSGGRLQRMHGAFVSDEAVAAVADYWRAMQRPDYKLDFTETAENGPSLGTLNGEDLSGDPMYKEAVTFVASQGKASISLLQRRFRIGFNRSARFIEQMEMDGIVGPADGSKPRPVLRGPE